MFNVGDKVRCLNGTSGGYGKGDPYLRAGVVYTVSEVFPRDTINVKDEAGIVRGGGTGSGGWFANRFESVKGKTMNHAMSVETARDQRQRLVNILGVNEADWRVRSRSWDGDAKFAALVTGPTYPKERVKLYTIADVDTYIENNQITNVFATEEDGTYTFVIDGVTHTRSHGALYWDNGLVTVGTKRYRIFIPAISKN
jgi:hypothetical protein